MIYVVYAQRNLFCSTVILKILRCKRKNKICFPFVWLCFLNIKIKVAQKTSRNIPQVLCFICLYWGRTSPQHDAATTVVHCLNCIVGVTCSLSFPPHRIVLLNSWIAEGLEYLYCNWVKGAECTCRIFRFSLRTYINNTF